MDKDQIAARTKPAGPLRTFIRIAVTVLLIVFVFAHFVHFAPRAVFCSEWKIDNPDQWERMCHWQNKILIVDKFVGDVW